MSHKNIAKICSFTIVALIIFTTPVAAQSSELVNFSISAVKNEKQVNNNVTYFDLMLLPGEAHTLEVDIFNSGNVPMEASVNAYTAGTNSSGVIDYDNPNVTDDSLKTSFMDIATVDSPIVSIPANSSERVKIVVEMPEESFDGVMLGGISVKKIDDESYEATQGTSITNEYCYILGVKIQETDALVEPDFRLLKVEPTLSNYRTSIAANLQNFEAAIVKGLQIDAKVYYENKSVPLYTNSSSDFNVAPNSNFNYIIPCESRLAAGNYRLTLTAQLDERIWTFEDTFSISAGTANNLNETSVNKPATNYYRIATIFLSILLLLLILIIIVRKYMKSLTKKDK